jgi:hypothetical protein
MSLSMEKQLIIEAWGRYRPSSKDNSPRNGVGTNNNKKKDIQNVFGERFMKRLITSVRQKTYLSKEERLNGGADGARADVKIQEQLNALLLQGDINVDEEALSDDGGNNAQDD